MATLVLAAAGQAIGSAIGGGIFGVASSAIGLAAGSYIGSYIDSALLSGSTKLPDAVGQRLDNLQVQVSTYGKTIPQVYGLTRLAGNVIWARNIKEEEIRTTTSSGGGKGGGGGATQTSVNYKYYATLAIAICEGEIDEIVRVWADSKQLDTNELQKAQGKYEVFLGSSTQNPSTIIESFEGAGNVTAYRGTSYVVIQDFPLEAYGNRIPNFTFEIKRKVKPVPAVEDKIKSIVMIPGSGEFVYSRDIIEKYQVVTDANGIKRQIGETEKVNMHNFENRPNVEIAVDQMLETLPNLEWVAVVVNWFATSKYAGSAEIFPKIEYLASGATTQPLEWSVAGYTRATAPIILFFPDGSPTYGGTPSDKSIIDLCVYLKSKGLNVLFYPMPLVDTTTDIAGEDNKPWRGRIAPSSAADVNTFFTRTNGYNRFIRHYSQLQVNGVYLKDNIDAFVIGSEMVGLTGYDSGGNTYPAVTQLKTLAGLVRSDVGAGVKLTYAADWSEYHSTGGYYNLDPLWTDGNIDFVGIDAYFPLTPDLDQSTITEAKIKEYWEKGEGWDYYYSDSINRTGLTSYGGSPVYAWKNVENWWNSAHLNPGSIATGWTAKLKPIWFTEYGFPSLDGCANQPNVFYDPKSIESFFPRKSRGRIDFLAQRQAINATEDFLETRNLQSGKADLIPRRFLWTWDARPYPFYPDLVSVWLDSVLWKYGHWINGKFGTSNLGAIVAELLNKLGFTSSDYDVSRLTDVVEGFVVDSQTTVRDALSILKSAYFFDMVESDGILKFIKRGGASVETINEDDLIPINSGNVREHFEITRTQELDLAQKVTISYLNRASQYQTGTQISQRQLGKAIDQVNINLPIVMSDQIAKQIADVTLYNMWVSRIAYNLRLMPEYAYLEPTDIITVNVNSVDHILRIVGTTLERNGSQQVTGIAEDIASYDFYTPPGESPVGNGQGYILPKSELILLDLPALPGDTGNDGILRAAINTKGINWKGSNLYRSQDGGVNGGNNFNFIGSTLIPAITGIVLNNVGNWTAGNIFDTTNTIDVALIGDATISSTNELALLNGSNAAVIGNEVIQFQTATLTSPGRYTLSRLLRGRLGTEHEIASHTAGENFVLLDSSLVVVSMPANTFGLLRHYKPVTVADTLQNTAEQAFSYTGKTLRPYSPVHIKGARDGSQNLTITWTRRSRISGDWRDNVDIPLGEENEKYDVEILNLSDQVVRTFSGVTAATVGYTAAEQTTDFASPQSSVKVRIYQLSTTYGRGVPETNTV